MFNIGQKVRLKLSKATGIVRGYGETLEQIHIELDGVNEGFFGTVDEEHLELIEEGKYEEKVLMPVV